MIVPSRITCGVDEPCGSAVHCAGLHARFAGKSDALVRLRNQLGAIALRHARLQRFVDGLVDLERGGVGELHQRQLVRVLDHAAAGGDGRAEDDFRLRRGGCDAFAPDQLRRLFDADRGRAEAAILQSVRDERVRAFVFVPRAHVGVIGSERTDGDLFARAILFERGTDEERLAFDRNDAREEPLAAAPAHAGEVDERRSAGEDQRADLVLGHQPLGLLDARAALVVRDRLGLIAHRRQRGDGGRQFAALRLREKRWRSPESGEGGGCANEFAAVHCRDSIWCDGRARVPAANVAAPPEILTLASLTQD